jgi:hypothetical protein
MEFACGAGPSARPLPAVFGKCRVRSSSTLGIQRSLGPRSGKGFRIDSAFFHPLAADAERLVRAASVGPTVTPGHTNPHPIEIDVSATSG